MTSEGQAEDSGYYFVCSKESIKVLSQGMTLDFKSRDQIINQQYIGRMGSRRLNTGCH